MSRDRFIIDELQRRYGINAIRRWAAQLVDPTVSGGTMADDIDRLANLLDVLLTNPQDGDALVFDGTSNKWKNNVVSSGGTLPIPSTQDFNGGPSVTLGNGGNDNLPWYTAAILGDDLVDLSDSTQPAVRTAGIYAVSVNITPTTNMSVDGYFDFV